MRRRLLRLFVVVGALIGSAMTFAAGGAGAGSSASVDDKGWWWNDLAEAPAGGVSVPVPVPAPDTAAGHVRVASTPRGAQALAALAFQLPTGASNPVLTLPIADGSATDDVQILACRTGSGWVGAEGGSWGSKPLVDCQGASVSGHVTSDGSGWEFLVAPLQTGNKLNVVIVSGTNPDAPAGANGYNFDVVFGPVNASVMAVSISDGEAPPPPAPVVPSFEPPVVADEPADVATPDIAAPTAPAPVAVPALEPADQGLAADAPAVQVAAPPLTTTTVQTRTGRPAGLVILLLAVAAGFYLWQQSGGRMPGIAGVAGDPADPPRLGGLGRFQRLRIGSPPSLT